MNETELIQKIRQATDECWKKLELRHEGIISIPDEIGQLRRLEELHLIGNALVKVPSAPCAACESFISPGTRSRNCLRSFVNLTNLNCWKSIRLG